MSLPTASDLLGSCLEAEGVRFVFGIPAWRCETASDLAERLEQAIASDGPSLIAVPIDYSPDVRLERELEGPML